MRLAHSFWLHDLEERWRCQDAGAVAEFDIRRPKLSGGKCKLLVLLLALLLSQRIRQPPRTTTVTTSSFAALLLMRLQFSNHDLPGLQAVS
jgi:hypothetical protein